MQKVWIAVAVGGVLAAALFAWQGNFSATFVAATIGVVAWFLNYRGQLSAGFDAEQQENSEQPNDEKSETQPSAD